MLKDLCKCLLKQSKFFFLTVVNISSFPTLKQLSNIALTNKYGVENGLFNIFKEVSSKNKYYYLWSGIFPVGTCWDLWRVTDVPVYRMLIEYKCHCKKDFKKRSFSIYLSQVAHDYLACLYIYKKNLTCVLLLHALISITQQPIKLVFVSPCR